MIITLILFTACGEDNMATIAEETTRSLVSTNVTDSTPYYEEQSITIDTHLSDTSFIVQDGELLAAGSNGNGQLGLGSTTTPQLDYVATGVTDVKSVYAGVYYTFIIKTDNTLWACGGVGASYKLLNIESSTFERIHIDNVKMVTINDNSVMIVKRDGSLHVAGQNINGELGVGDKDLREYFTDTNLTGVSYASLGFFHSAIIKDGYVYTSGSNTKGQLGLNDNTERTTFTKTTRTADIVSSGYRHTLAVSSGNLYSVGENIAGQLGIGSKVDQNSWQNTSQTDVVQVSGGWVHSIYRKSNNAIYGAGANNVGQIGLGGTAESTSFASIGITATSAVAGYNHTIAIVSNTAYSTGYNANGQLGLNDTTTRTTFTSATESVDTFNNTYWKPFYTGDFARIDNDRYYISLLGSSEPSIFTSLALVGKANPYKPFDNQNITPAIFTSPMTYTVKGTEPFNSFTLAKVLATSITYTFKNSVGATIKTDTAFIDCKRDENGTLSLYPTTVTYYADTQMEANSTVEISLTHSDDIELGDFTLNNAIDAGFTNLAFSLGIVDYNSNAPDEWGQIPEGDKAVISTFDVSMNFRLTNLDYMSSFVQSISSKYVTIDATDSKGLAPNGSTIFGSLIRRVKVFNPKIVTKVKDGSLAPFATLTMKAQEIV